MLKHNYVADKDGVIRYKDRESNGPGRPNSYGRRARKLALLGDDTLFNGDGNSCDCAHCGKRLTFATLELDRVIPGTQDGDYSLHNLIPACRKCNAQRGDKTLWQFNPRLARKLHRRGIQITVPRGTLLRDAILSVN